MSAEVNRVSQHTYGVIVGRETLTRACGCACEFLHYEHDLYRERRRQKFLVKSCPPCAEKREQEIARLAKEARAQKATEKQERTEGEVGMAVLPVGAQIFLEKQPDGSWQAALNAQGILVEENRPDHRGLLYKLAVLWRKKRFWQAPRIVSGSDSEEKFP